MNAVRRALATGTGLLAISSAVACASSASTGATSDAAGPDATDDSGASSDFATRVAEPLSRSCGGCHGPTRPERGLVLDDPNGALRSRLVNIPSSEAPSMNLVTPGDTDNSFLVRKIKGTLTGISCSSSCGAEMPIGNAYPPQNLQDLEDWIAKGAQ